MKEQLIIPGSIIVAGAIIGAAIYFGGGAQTSAPIAANQAPTNQPTQAQDIQAKKVDAVSDYIVGNPSADIFVLEYSDLECPFCKRYHDTTLSQLKQEYADNERVSFVFRHFPLDEPYTRALHPTATEQHIALECVGRIGGTEAFYNFVEQSFADESNNGTHTIDTLSTFATNAGVDENAFRTCYTNGDTEGVVAASFQEGVDAGVQGTPTVFIQTKEGKTFPAVPDYNALKISIDAYLAELN